MHLAPHFIQGTAQMLHYQRNLEIVFPYSSLSILHLASFFFIVVITTWNIKIFNICLPHFKFHKSMEFVFTINFYSLKA